MDAPTLFLQGAAKPLLLLHTVAAVAGAGACTHLAIVSVRLLRGAAGLSRLARIYAQVIGGTYAAAFGLGLLLYPNYRYTVRGLYLDRYEPWASNLFDVKENLAGLGLPLALALFFLGRRLDATTDAPLLPWLTFLALSLWAIVLATSLSGLLVTSVRGV